MIFDEQNSACNPPTGLLDRIDGQRCGGFWKHQSDRRSNVRHRFDLSMTAVTLDDAVHLGETETCARFTLGREEGLESTLADLGGHADSGVADLETNLA